MELKRLLTHFIYRIEPKPGGGFIAHPSDPTVPPLEAPTREELQQKIQANIAAALTSEFPGLKLNLANKEMKFDFHVEHKPGGGFTIHSSSPGTAAIEAEHSESLERRFAEKVMSMLGEDFAPELSKALAGRGEPTDIKVIVKKNVGKASEPSRVSAIPQFSLENSGASPEMVNCAVPGSPSANSLVSSNSPILPEGANWPRFAVMIAALLIAALLYFLLRTH